MTQVQTHEIRLEKTIAAPLDKVRRAFTDPKLLAKWFAPGPMEAAVHSLDVREGGQYEVAMTGPGPDGEVGTHTCTGVFHEVAERKLVMSFNWTEEALPNDTTLTFEFHPDGDSTRVVLLHTGLPTKEAAEMHTQGWEGCLAKLPDAV